MPEDPPPPLPPSSPSPYPSSDPPGSPAPWCAHLLLRAPATPLATLLDVVLDPADESLHRRIEDPLRFGDAAHAAPELADLRGTVPAHDAVLTLVPACRGEERALRAVRALARRLQGAGALVALWLPGRRRLARGGEILETLDELLAGARTVAPVAPGAPGPAERERVERRPRCPTEDPTRRGYRAGTVVTADEDPHHPGGGHGRRPGRR